MEEVKVMENVANAANGNLMVVGVTAVATLAVTGIVIFAVKKGKKLAEDRKQKKEKVAAEA